jgi:hypothetical protein
MKTTLNYEAGGSLANGMTYGECCIAEQDSMILRDGEWVKTVHILKKPQRMVREDADKYYTNKIRDYFGIKKEPVFYVRDREFESIQEHFDYYEAMKYRQELACGT